MIHEILKKSMNETNLTKLKKLNNDYVEEFVSKIIEHCEPDNIFVSDGSDADISYIRDMAVKTGEEKKLALDGHTIHFDGYNDQARDKAHTKFLIPSDKKFDPNLNYIDREGGLQEIFDFMKGIMKGHTMYIGFYVLGPLHSKFSIPALQITDSPYVAHSENLLYRQGYKEFLKLEKKERFFKLFHSEGELENGVSKNLDKRRVYIDLEENTTYSVNTQYGGNTLGLKKLSMRLAINLADKEGWLTEHMFVMGVSGKGGRTTYLTGAYPSACGKTSTSMMFGEKIIGDDIAYLKIIDNKVKGVNVEQGAFGIIDGVNPEDDPILWQALTNPGEVIFSNILVTENNEPYWMGRPEPLPEKGFNFSGEWTKDKKDSDGKAIPPAHKNARFTVNLYSLPNLDKENIENPEGVEIGGIIYGGRDSDTSIPVEEAFDWTHGIVTKGAALESETTAAALGQVGVRKFNPMSNLDFLSIPISKYIQNNIDFGKKVSNPPKIFSVNYFLKNKEGKFLNDKTDKAVWLKWMDLRIHNEADAIETPTGLIPIYDDLKSLFKEVLNKEYKLEDYIEQFTIRIPENLSKLERIEKIYKEKIPNTSEEVFSQLSAQKERLLKLQAEKGDYVSPKDL